MVIIQIEYTIHFLLTITKKNYLFKPFSLFTRLEKDWEILKIASYKPPNLLNDPNIYKKNVVISKQN